MDHFYPQYDQNGHCVNQLSYQYHYQSSQPFNASNHFGYGSSQTSYMSVGQRVNESEVNDNSDEFSSDCENDGSNYPIMTGKVINKGKWSKQEVWFYCYQILYLSFSH